MLGDWCPPFPGYHLYYPRRFVENGADGVTLQLPLNHDHLTYMGDVLSRLGLAAAA
jgi:hypothetical protein